MFANLESFSIFFFSCLALIVLAIVFEDKLIDLEAKRLKRKDDARNCAKNKASASTQVKRSSHQPAAHKRVPAQKSARRNIAA